MIAALRPPPSPRARARARSWLAVALVLASAPGCGSDASSRPQSAPAVAVQTVTVEPREIFRTIDAVGTLRSPESSELAFEIDGKIVFLAVPEGEHVEAGRVLARIDDSRARAAVKIAEAHHANAKRDAARARDLRKQKVISDQAFDDVMTALEAAEGELEDARAVLEKTELRAPFTGDLGLKHVSMGAYVDAGDPVVVLTRTDPLDLVFAVPQTELPRVAVGQAVRGAAVDCSEVFRGVVTAIVPDIDPATRAIRLQARVDNADGELAPGMGARVRLEVERVPNALIVPQEALVREGTRHLVFVVTGDTAERRTVGLGDFFPDGVEIRSGVAAGDVVIVSGQQKLRPGAKIEAKPYQPTDNPNLELGLRKGVTRCEI